MRTLCAPLHVKCDCARAVTALNPSALDRWSSASEVASTLLEVADHVPLGTAKSGSTSIRTWIPSFEAIPTSASSENFEILPR